ncbi:MULTISPECIES: hypothetical protein [Streptomyces]|uniref:Uncharacterized protein n=2 Tax=Streptomyces TaxID=1883 RepID=A0A100Y119_9ACTN|nr:MULTISPECIES: hypothetical protein [Streptomyces]KUH35717.1 hypothetical protein ATE80_27670 [Streptomyces kanasensis]UUS32119.1 hypothetical protein NRO40_15690 [Streptomyces changanensis]
MRSNPSRSTRRTGRLVTGAALGAAAVALAGAGTAHADATAQGVGSEAIPLGAAGTALLGHTGTVTGTGMSGATTYAQGLGQLAGVAGGMS